MRGSLKYWSYFAAKMLLIGGVLAGILPLFRMLLPAPEPFLTADLQPMGHDLLYTICAYAFWMMAAGMIYVAVWDQRLRCRTCLRRLRMPIARGDLGRMLLLGRPHLEYICAYGHGTLKVPELHFAGNEPTNWAKHEDIWTELELLDTEKR